MQRRCCGLAGPAPRSASAVAASAGKNDSIASSDMVMSTAVPNVATVLKKRSSRSPRRGRRSGTTIAARAGRAGAGGPG